MNEYIFLKDAMKKPKKEKKLKEVDEIVEYKLCCRNKCRRPYYKIFFGEKLCYIHYLVEIDLLRIEEAKNLNKQASRTHD